MVSIGGIEKPLRRSAAEVVDASLLSQVGLLADALLQATTQSTRLLLGALSHGQAGDDRYDGALSFYRLDQAPTSVSGTERELLDGLTNMVWDERVARWPDLERLGRKMAAMGMGPEVLQPEFDVRAQPSNSTP